jgi:hypothetical protein
MLVSSRPRRLALAALFAALGGCAPAPAEAPESLREETAAPVAPRFDLDTAIERARAAFFERDGVLFAGTETHRVELDGRGGFFVTPAHDTERERAFALPHVAPSEPRPARAQTSRIEAAQAFEAHTASIDRGGVSAAAQPAAARTEDGAAWIARGAVTEVLRDGPDGLEQSWRFAAQPEGQGDLEVRVAVSGMEHVGTTPSGEHFADAATGLGVRYGHGTWVDARGERTAVPVRFESDQLVLRVPARVVAASRYPAVLDPVIGPEVAMDTPVVGPRGGNQIQPALAGNGADTFLLVFTDGLFGEDDVRAARFDASGVLLDGRSFPIADEVGSNQRSPAVAWNGSGWVVVWQDGRSGTDFDIFGTTVSAGGAVRAAGGAPISATTGIDETTPALAAAGGVTMLAFTSGDASSSDVVGMRLDASGVSTDAVPFSIGAGAGVQNLPAVAASTAQFLVTYDDDPDGSGPVGVSVRGRRFQSSGPAAVDAAPFLVAASGFGSHCAFSGGSSYLAVWTGFASGRFAALSGAIPVAGAVPTPSAVTISPGVSGRDYVFPRVAWNGSEYLAVFIDGVFDGAMGAFTELSVGARRLTAAGAGSGSAIDPTSLASTTTPDVAAIGSTFYLVYVDTSGAASDIRGTRISGSTVATPAGQLLSSGPNDQTSPYVASHGAGWGVVWTDFRGGEVDVWAAILDGSGTVVGAPVPAVTGMGTQAATGIAWAGSRYLVVYEERQGEGDIRGFTMTDIGIAAAPFPIATSATMTELEPTVACGPSSIRCLVAWTELDRAAASLDSSVRAARVDASSPIATVGATATVAAAAGNQFAPAAAASNSTFYVAWTDTRDPAGADVRGTRFLTSASEVGGAIVSGAAGDQGDAAVASNGADFVVVFSDLRAGGPRPFDVYFQRVEGATGAIRGPNTMIGASGDDESQASIAFNGRYLVTWTRRDGTNAWIEGARVESAGTLVDATPFEITPSAGLADAAEVASGGAAGRWLVTYRGSDGSTVRTFARQIADDDTPPFRVDAGTPDAGSIVAGGDAGIDAGGGATDSGADAAAAPDAALEADAGGGDAGTDEADAGVSDGDAGGLGPDAGVEDAGSATADAGGTTADAGGASASDAGRADTGILPVDAGATTDAGPAPGARSGCGCAVPARRVDRGPALLALLGLLALIARRRR